MEIFVSYRSDDFKENIRTRDADKHYQSCLWTDYFKKRIEEDVFSSLAGEDAVNVFNDKRDVVPGDNVLDVLKAHLERTNVFIRLISPLYYASKWCGAETEIFRGLPSDRPTKVIEVKIKSIFEKDFKKQSICDVKNCPVAFDIDKDGVERMVIPNIEKPSEDLFDTLISKCVNSIVTFYREKVLEVTVKNKEKREYGSYVTIASALESVNRERDNLIDRLSKENVGVRSELYPGDREKHLFELKKDLEESELYIQLLSAHGAVKQTGDNVGLENAQWECARRENIPAIVWRFEKGEYSRTSCEFDSCGHFVEGPDSDFEKLVTSILEKLKDEPPSFIIKTEFPEEVAWISNNLNSLDREPLKVQSLLDDASMTVFYKINDEFGELEFRKNIQITSCTKKGTVKKVLLNE